MNRIYRVVFNKTLGVMQAVSELQRRFGTSKGASNTTASGRARLRLAPVVLALWLIMGAAPLSAMASSSAGTQDCVTVPQYQYLNFQCEGDKDYSHSTHGGNQFTIGNVKNSTVTLTGNPTLYIWTPFTVSQSTLKLNVKKVIMSADLTIDAGSQVVAGTNGTIWQVTHGITLTLGSAKSLHKFKIYAYGTLVFQGDSFENLVIPLFQQVQKKGTYNKLVLQDSSTGFQGNSQVGSFWEVDVKDKLVSLDTLPLGSLTLEGTNTTTTYTGTNANLITTMVNTGATLVLDKVLPTPAGFQKITLKGGTLQLNVGSTSPLDLSKFTSLLRGNVVFNVNQAVSNLGGANVSVPAEKTLTLQNGVTGTGTVTVNGTLDVAGTASLGTVEFDNGAALKLGDAGNLTITSMSGKASLSMPLSGASVVVKGGSGALTLQVPTDFQAKSDMINTPMPLGVTLAGKASLALAKETKSVTIDGQKYNYVLQARKAQAKPGTMARAAEASAATTSSSMPPAANSLEYFLTLSADSGCSTLDYGINTVKYQCTTEGQKAIFQAYEPDAGPAVFIQGGTIDKKATVSILNTKQGAKVTQVYVIGALTVENGSTVNLGSDINFIRVRSNTSVDATSKIVAASPAQLQVDGGKTLTLGSVDSLSKNITLKLFKGTLKFTGESMKGLNIHATGWNNFLTLADSDTFVGGDEVANFFFVNVQDKTVTLNKLIKWGQLTLGDSRHATTTTYTGDHIIRTIVNNGVFDVTNMTPSNADLANISLAKDGTLKLSKDGEDALDLSKLAQTNGKVEGTVDINSNQTASNLGTVAVTVENGKTLSITGGGTGNVTVKGTLAVNETSTLTSVTGDGADAKLSLGEAAKLTIDSLSGNVPVDMPFQAGLAVNTSEVYVKGGKGSLVLNVPETLDKSAEQLIQTPLRVAVAKEASVVFAGKARTIKVDGVDYTYALQTQKFTPPTTSTSTATPRAASADNAATAATATGPKFEGTAYYLTLNADKGCSSLSYRNNTVSYTCDGQTAAFQATDNAAGAAVFVQGGTILNNSTVTILNGKNGAKVDQVYITKPLIVSKDSTVNLGSDINLIRVQSDTSVDATSKIVAKSDNAQLQVDQKVTLTLGSAASVQNITLKFFRSTLKFTGDSMKGLNIHATGVNNFLTLSGSDTFTGGDEVANFFFVNVMDKNVTLNKLIKRGQLTLSNGTNTTYTGDHIIRTLVNDGVFNVTNMTPTSADLANIHLAKDGTLKLSMDSDKALDLSKLAQAKGVVDFNSNQTVSNLGSVNVTVEGGKTLTVSEDNNYSGTATLNDDARLTFNANTSLAGLNAKGKNTVTLGENAAVLVQHLDGNVSVNMSLSPTKHATSDQLYVVDGKDAVVTLVVPAKLQKNADKLIASPLRVAVVGKDVSVVLAGKPQVVTVGDTNYVYELKPEAYVAKGATSARDAADGAANATADGYNEAGLDLSGLADGAKAYYLSLVEQLVLVPADTLKGLSVAQEAAYRTGTELINLTDRFQMPYSAHRVVVYAEGGFQHAQFQNEEKYNAGLFRAGVESNIALDAHNKLRVGAMVDLQSGSTETFAKDLKLKQNRIRVGVYAGGTTANGYAGVYAGYEHVSQKIDNLNFTRGLNALQFSVEGGVKVFEINQFSLTPEAQLQYTHFMKGNYTADYAGLKAKGDTMSNDGFKLRAGVKLNNFQEVNGISWNVYGRLSLVRETEADFQYTAVIKGYYNVNTYGQKFAETSVQLDAGVNANVNDNLSLTLKVMNNIVLGNNASDYSVSGGLNFKF